MAKSKKPTPPIPFAETRYGFNWGAAEVSRGFDDKSTGSVTLILETPKQEIQIYVTRTGKIRIHDRNGEWFCQPSREV
jgi:hypothetical protein